VRAGFARFREAGNIGASADVDEYLVGTHPSAFTRIVLASAKRCAPEDGSVLQAREPALHVLPREPRDFIFASLYGFHVDRDLAGYAYAILARAAYRVRDIRARNQ
jgi:hypothetical protein